MKLNLQYNLKKDRAKIYCEHCGIHVLVIGKHNLEQHRLNPRGPYTDENVVILCDKCHKRAHVSLQSGKPNNAN